jgi:hypothetical protein
MTSLLASRSESSNAKVAAIALTIAAFMTLVLTHTSMSLAPLRILVLSGVAFAVWSFCDEMGLQKPLNRAGFVLFSVAAISKVLIALGLEPQVLGRYYFLYSAFVLLALLFWSVAFLHRQRELKLVGVVGVAATLAPIGALVAGHLVVGFGAFLGVQSLLASTGGDAPADMKFVTLVERIFGLWGYLAAWFLWRGYMVREPSTSR